MIRGASRIIPVSFCLSLVNPFVRSAPQRVLGVGGTAGMVHPSTGFMMARMLGMAPTVADSIIEQLSRPADQASRLASEYLAPSLCGWEMNR